MRRIVLIHWNAAEAAERAALLRAAGYTADIKVKPGPADLRPLLADPPAAILIDLSRIPSQGRDIGIALRQRKATRGVPLVFAAGAPEKVAATRALLPDAFYAEWPAIPAALEQALAAPPASPAVPKIMDGYSGAPLPKKLGIRPGRSVALLGAPAKFEDKLGALPEGVRIQTQARGPCDLILLFVRSRHDLERRFHPAQRALAEKGGLWIVWPKKTSALATDLTQQAIRDLGLSAGLVDYKICAVDETWSGLLFAWRRK